MAKTLTQLEQERFILLQNYAIRMSCVEDMTDEDRRDEAAEKYRRIYLPKVELADKRVVKAGGASKTSYESVREDQFRLFGF